MLDFHALLKLGTSFESWGEQYKSDPDAAFEAIEDCMDQLLDMITADLPKEAREKLNPFHVQAIFEAFMGLSRIEPKPDAQPQPKKLSQDSSDSMAASRKTG